MDHFQIERAQRLSQLPPYLFSEIDKAKRKAIEEGIDIINLGIGDPDMPTPENIIRALCDTAANPANHRYPSYEGLLELRHEFSLYMKRRFDVELSPDNEVLTLIGSKEGIAHLPLALVNPGDFVLIPDPGYPVYRASTVFAGGIPYTFPLLADNDFLPDFDDIDPQIAERAKLIFLNYPNNPTAAVADRGLFERAVEFAKKHNIIICQDAAYCELAFDGHRPVSILEAPGGKDVAVEFHSLSKTYNMTGWRVGFAAGNRDIISALGAVKTNIDSGVFQAVQYAGIAALRTPVNIAADIVSTYAERRDTLVDGLNSLGWRVPKPKATFYLWVTVPPGYTSTELTTMLLKEAGIVTTPGIGFGRNGEGYIRMALTVKKERLAEAVERIKNIRI
ncbi:MAG: LL-diaminopimelate aminotransferase [Candidatus Abyssobacteria bacterium SURF_17]|uniref:Aminotransferase n=1 Tax=Candidatus Abyssobacteria bacterium SURF_17 TaxID=2093361 RepID=A0A419F7H9_9BACT|nr:MAG: LL-diaminopimelate aminotransferase [Candidatus Abyssubacteria bacterium SURF_17]